MFVFDHYSFACLALLAVQFSGAVRKNVLRLAIMWACPDILAVATAGVLLLSLAVLCNPRLAALSVATA